MPAGAFTQSIFTPVAATTRHAACVTSGPIPSPSIKTICMDSPREAIGSECQRYREAASTGRVFGERQTFRRDEKAAMRSCYRAGADWRNFIC